MRRTKAIGLAFCLVFATTPGSSSAQAERRPLPLSQAVALALESNPDALSAQARLEEARAARAGARGGFGPKVHIDANVQQWSSPYAIGLGNQSFTVRNAFTWVAGVSLVQPLTTLFTIYDQYRIQEFGVDVAGIRRVEAQRDVALGVVDAYYRLLEATGLSEVADASVAQLEAQEKQASALFTNGVIGKNDLLRAGLALASAKRRSIEVRGQVEIVRGQLASSMGVADADGYEPVPFTGDPPATDEPSLQAAETRAIAQRVELRELDRRIAKADKEVGLAKTKLIPQVSAIANYTHTEGSPFSQVDAAYLGLFASWDVWDWGTTVGGIDEADARLQQARLGRKKLEDQIRLEAREAFVNTTTAREALSVARTAVAQAEENYRIVSKKFENAAATSFDVVDAEGLLTEARGQVTTALYDLLIAQAALEKATGAEFP